jgi:hypothetical protein
VFGDRGPRWAVRTGFTGLPLFETPRDPKTETSALFIRSISHFSVLINIFFRLRLKKIKKKVESTRLPWYKNL